MTVSGAGVESERTRHVTSPGTPSGSREVASTFTEPCCAKRPAVSRAHGSTRCSQLSSTKSVGWCGNVAIELLDGFQPRYLVGAERREHCWPDRALISDSGELDEPHAPGELLQEIRGHVEREPCLADASGSGQRHQPLRAARAERARRRPRLGR